MISVHLLVQGATYQAVSVVLLDLGHVHIRLQLTSSKQSPLEEQDLPGSPHVISRTCLSLIMRIVALLSFLVASATALVVTPVTRSVHIAVPRAAIPLMQDGPMVGKCKWFK